VSKGWPRKREDTVFPFGKEWNGGLRYSCRRLPCHKGERRRKMKEKTGEKRGIISIGKSFLTQK